MRMLVHLLQMIILLIPLAANADELMIFGDDFGPPKYYMENDKPKGIVVDIVKWCMEEIDQPYTIKLYPWKRAYKNARAAKGMIIGLSKSSERLMVFDYSDPLFVGDLMIVVKKGEEFDFLTESDLRGMFVGVELGSSYGDVFDQLVKNGTFKIHEFSQPENALKMIYAGRLDAMLIGPGEYGVKQVVSKSGGLRMADFSILPVPFSRDAKYLAVHKSLKMEGFINKFNIVLGKGIKEGAVDKIINGYLGN